MQHDQKATANALAVVGGGLYTLCATWTLLARDSFIAAYFDQITCAVVEVQGSSWDRPRPLDFAVRSRELGMWYPASTLVRELVSRRVPTYGVDARAVYRFFREQNSYPREQLARTVKEDLELEYAQPAGKQRSTDYVSAIALGMYFLANIPVLTKSVESVPV